MDVAEGGSQTFTVGLNGTLQAGATVAVTVAATLAANDDNAEFRVDADVDLAAWTHTFTAGVTLGRDNPVTVDPVTVTLTAFQDGNAINGRNFLTFSTTSEQDHDNDSTNDDRGFTSARLTITEDDDLGVTVSERALTVREGDATGKMYTRRLGLAADPRRDGHREGGLAGQCTHPGQQGRRHGRHYPDVDVLDHRVEPRTDRDRDGY